MSDVICATESSLFFASTPICEATTANPRPASPARAASIDAFKESRFVSSAISPISFIISTISPEAVPTLSTASSRLCMEISILWSAFPTLSISAFPFSDTSTVVRILSSTLSLSSLVSATTPASWVAFCAISLTETDSWSTVAFSSVMDCDWIFAAEFISPETFLLDPACFSRRSETCPICRIISFIDAIKCSTLRPITAISSFPFTFMDTVKSPDAMLVITLVISFTGRITTCVTRSIRTHNTRIEIMLKMIIRFRNPTRSASTTRVGT